MNDPAAPEPHPPPRRSGQLVRAYLVFAALFVLASCAMAVVFRYDVLMRDQWMIYGTYLERPFWASVWAPYNGHRMLFPALLYRADLAFFAAGTWDLVLCQYALALALAWVLAREVVRGGPEPLRRVVAGFVFVAMFWMGKNLDLTFTLGVVPHLTALAAALALLGGLNAADAARAGRHRAAGGWTAGAMGGAAIATLSFSNGFLAWPVLVVVGRLARLPRRLLVALSVVGAVAVALYLAGNRGAAGMAWQRATLADFLRLAVNFLGAPAAHALDPVISVRTPAMVTVAFTAGLVLLAATLAVAVRLAPRLWRDPPRDMLMALGLLLFVGGTALAVAYGRVEQSGPASGASQRYVTWGVLYLTALGMLLPALAPPAPGGRRFTALAGAGLAALSLLLVPTHLAWGLASGRTNLRAVEAALALVVGVRDDERVLAVLSDGRRRMPVVYRVAAEMKARRLNLFAAPFAALPGRPVPTDWAAVGTESCRGAVTAMGAAPGDGGPRQEEPRQEGLRMEGLRIEGWAWDPAARRPPRLVVLIDRHGTVRGVGRFTRPAPVAPPLPAPAWVRLAAWIDPVLPAILGRGAGWRGYARPGEAIAAFAVLADGHSLCPLSSALSVPEAAR